ncbi:hypothetical protein K0M31_011909 [Melipona bicolor]|uniref:Uncharacterized protein n=1 Tax=Melipona bicolor TaxID=60889 RepID=A0AA40GBP6_9HYME|nr:hypothetical protein K0M31_011909 [Melipona bicolor]
MRDVYRDEIFPLTRPRLFKGKRQTLPNKFRLPREKERRTGKEFTDAARGMQRSTIPLSEWISRVAENCAVCLPPCAPFTQTDAPLDLHRILNRYSRHDSLTVSFVFSAHSPSLDRALFPRLPLSGDKIPAYDAIVSIRFLRGLILKANIRISENLPTVSRESREAALSTLENRFHRRGSRIDEIVKPAGVNSKGDPEAKKPRNSSPTSPSTEEASPLAAKKYRVRPINVGINDAGTNDGIADTETSAKTGVMPRTSQLDRQSVEDDGKFLACQDSGGWLKTKTKEGAASVFQCSQTIRVSHV